MGSPKRASAATQEENGATSKTALDAPLISTRSVETRLLVDGNRPSSLAVSRTGSGTETDAAYQSCGAFR
jgi:hypothetical protein